METHVVPVKIRTHLIPFFYQELEGVSDAVYLGKTVKACKINGKSSLGFMMLQALRETDAPVIPTQYYVYISFDAAELGADFYEYSKKKSKFLMVPEKVNEKINHMLEDLFRLAFQYQMKGMLKSNPKLEVQEAISQFMVEYELDEYGFNLDSMRRLLNRGASNKLGRFQNKVANRALNVDKNMS